ncbi:MAG TPA: hypothetical protein VGP72_03860 [Planctomycetota bacterium]|jgi:hypothetical protein
MAKNGEVSDLLGLALDPFSDDADEVQSTRQPTARLLKRMMKDKAIAGLKRETLAALVTAPPAPGECLHIISNGHFDYFNFVPLILGWIETADELYGSTWTMSRQNALDLLAFYDSGKVNKITMASGNYFLRRESTVANTILEGLRARGQRFRTWENHAKLILLSNAANGAYFVVEGSANWTANPRTEQNILLNDRTVYDFHRQWLEEMFHHGKD